ncbi:MAG TPA: CRISPR-associated endonuclease Cas1 [Candidatus Tumulicola sp.]|nr:CRISPR-associated endonuclease Cas1 [Candidatus Tumulicola sp.]
MAQILEAPPELLPARMVNEFVYCPRLFWLEYVEREFDDSYDTVDGSRIHRRVDVSRGELPDDIREMKANATSVELGSQKLGVVAKIDLLRSEDGNAVPVDFKRGKAPIGRGPYDPERVQLCIQALLLREHGYRCDAGRLYYAASKTTVNVPIDDELIATTLMAIAGARVSANASAMPPPLVDSPKCGRCSLHAICLPDEINALRGIKTEIRPFGAPADDRIPLYVMEPGARVGLREEVVEIRTDAGTVADCPILEVGSVSLFGNVQISSQALRALLARDVPAFYLSYGGWLNGYARSVNDHSLDLRIVQHRVALNADRCAALAKQFVSGKIRNQRTMVRRSLGQSAKKTLQAMAFLEHRVQHVKNAEELLGLEGMAAKHYFEAYGEMLGVATGFEVTGRSRRPPTDPVNAMLSFGYAMLAKEALAAVIAVGFEPGLGFYHRVRPGRPSLALDLMEEFRPLIVDSTVLSLINTREIQASQFDRRGRAVVLTDEGRRIFIGALERRLRTSIHHPTFGYQVTYRRAMNVQARLLARAIQGDIAAYPAFLTR